MRFLLVLALLVGANRSAAADILDLSLQRLVTPGVGGVADVANDLPAQAAYRQLVSELGVALSPKFLSTADTIGYSGFQFTVDTSFTSISNRLCAPGETKDRCPWQYGVVGSRDAQGNPRGLPEYLSTVSITARKGIWLPIPSFELGAGATKLFQSDMYAIHLYGKLAIHEGYHDWALPSIALRGSVVRLLGTSQVDLTMPQIDLEISKSFGVFGTLTLVPYLGAATLFIVARGQVLDTTPAIDAYRQGPGSLDLNANAVFPDQDLLVRWRFFGGFRLNYSILVLTFDYALTACGDFSGDPSNECKHAGTKVPDNSGNQHTFSLSAGVLF